LANTIDFYFDFSSPYGYLASHRIEEIASKHDREIVWRPFLLGKVFQLNGNEPLLGQKLKGDYSGHDIQRTARRYGIHWQLPDPFPIPTQAAGRTFYWLQEKDPEGAVSFAKAAFNAYFKDGINILPKETVAGIASSCGVGESETLDAINDPGVKALLLEASDQAIERGVCGSPYFIADQEPFWGQDKLAELDEWLESGGW